MRAQGTYDSDGFGTQARNALTRIVRLTWYVVDRDSHEQSGAAIAAAWKDTLGT